MNPANLLIVEDETIVALDMKYQLQKQGYSVCGIFNSGEECLDNIEALQPDLVLMDIRLQGKIDGVEAAGVIREKHRIPVVFITAYTDDETLERAKYIEPFGYIIKPFDERSLRTTIEMALYKHSMDKKLIESEERYRKFFEEDLSGDFMADAEGRILNCNSAFKTMFKLPMEETLDGLNLDGLFYTDLDRREFWKEFLVEKRFINQTLNMRTMDGAFLVVVANVIGACDTAGTLREIKGYFIDNTERIRLEEQLRHAQKMEAIGRLAGGIAHDFNNILTVIIGYTALAEEKLKDGCLIEEDIEGIKSAAKRASNLTRQLLIFSRRQMWSPRVVSLNLLVENMEKMIRRLIKENIRFQFIMDSIDPHVFVDPSQIEQVLVNLSVNARDAMPKGGKLTIKTGIVNNIDPSDDGDGALGDYALLKVSDTGLGIDEKYIDKIFDPFFTTKSYNEGTGLGLATVYGIVKQSKGYIKVASASGAGTSFSIFFPLKETETIPEEETFEPVTAAKEPSLDGDETILLVEDEDGVRELIARYLSRKGYHILEARNAGEAIIQFEKYFKQIRLVIADVLLPLERGDELAARLRRQTADLKVLFISGYPRKGFPDDEEFRFPEGEAPEGDEPDGKRRSWYLQKPFEAADLLLKVRNILDS